MDKKWIFYFFTFWIFASIHASAMTLEEKIGQLLIVHFNGTEANEDAKRLIEEAHVGGFIYYNWANGLETPEQVETLSKGLQNLSKIPLWICVDQEGGPVSRLKWLPFPGSRKIAELPLIEAEHFALELGSQLRELGVNMNLAPVVDISTNPQSSYISKRTFGDTPEIVIPYAKAFLTGCKPTRVVSVLKHFPGYGDVWIDPHADLPVLNKSLEELEKVELAPYRALIDQADAIMTAHILVPALDEEKCATLSEKIITGLLREKLGFKGLVITDSLVMDGLLKNCGSLEEAAIESLLAGCDLLILGGKRILEQQSGLELTVERNFRIFKALVDAVNNGRIPIERVDEAVGRILSLKRSTTEL